MLLNILMKEEGYEKTLMFLSREIPWHVSEETGWVLGKTTLETWRFKGRPGSR